MLSLLHTCNWCGQIEERMFTDSWSGLELCLACLGPVADYVTNSPGSEGDNLKDELKARVDDRRPWYEIEDEEEEESLNH